MQRNAPLRDPYAPEEEEQPYSGAGGPLPRLPRSGPAPPLRHPTETLTSSSFRSLPSNDSVPGSSRPNVSLGALRSSISRQDPNDAASAGPSAAPRSLGLSLGLPRNRMAARSGNNDAPSGVSANVPIAANQADEAVRNTDSDALLSRLSALKLGYLPPEPYTQEFSTSSHSDYGTPLSRSDQSNTPARRSPLINIGTYLRCTTIDSEVEAFLKQRDTPKQIISIGAGSDSRYWRIMTNPDLSSHLGHYLEIDFDENTSHKVTRILRSPILRSSLDSDSLVHGVPLNNLSPNAATQQDNKARLRRMQVLRSSKYSLLAADLRNLHPDTPFEQRIDPDLLFGSHSTALQPGLPTLILFECVLAYITPNKADWLVELLGKRFANITAVSYDIALAGDAEVQHSISASFGQGTATSASSYVPPSRFGRVMLQNLEIRKLSLPGAKAYPTIGAQSQRFTRAWSSTSSSQVEACGRSLFSIWSALDAEQKNRLSRLEGLDEVEEIDMLLKHYCIVKAQRTS
ncbi:hypothetical protein NDA13_000069 [Ustilago tritici]|nr:hypothetical protein NDA13_000069 [Ustilago tritici]